MMTRNGSYKMAKICRVNVIGEKCINVVPFHTSFTVWDMHFCKTQLVQFLGILPSTTNYYVFARVWI